MMHSPAQDVQHFSSVRMLAPCFGYVNNDKVRLASGARRLPGFILRQQAVLTAAYPARLKGSHGLAFYTRLDHSAEFTGWA